jgi:hypothetical protein
MIKIYNNTFKNRAYMINLYNRINQTYAYHHQNLWLLYYNVSICLVL